MLPFPRSPFSSGKLLLFRGNETAHRVCYFRAAGQNTLLCRAYGTRRNTVYRFRGKFPSVLRSKRRSFPLKNKSRRPEPDGFFLLSHIGQRFPSKTKRQFSQNCMVFSPLPQRNGILFRPAVRGGSVRLRRAAIGKALFSPVACCGKNSFFPAREKRRPVFCERRIGNALKSPAKFRKRKPLPQRTPF